MATSERARGLVESKGRHGEVNGITRRDERRGREEFGVSVGHVFHLVLKSIIKIYTRRCIAIGEPVREMVDLDAVALVGVEVRGKAVKGVHFPARDVGCVGGCIRGDGGSGAR